MGKGLLLESTVGLACCTHTVGSEIPLQDKLWHVFIALCAFLTASQCPSST